MTEVRAPGGLYLDLHHGDCVELMSEMPESSIDAIVTDPPYGLEFMGKEWDRLGGYGWESSIGKTGYTDAERLARPNFGSTRNPMCRTCRKHQRGTGCCECPKPDFDQAPADANRRMQAWHEAWAIEALRVLKPGGHLLAFGGTRTYHRLACAIEDAGFEIRDSIAWQHQERIFCACDNLMCGVREGVPDVSAAASPSEGADVLPPVQRSTEGAGVGAARAQGSGQLDRREPRKLQREDERSVEPGVEGRGDAEADARQPQGREVRSVSGVGAADEQEGRLRDGAPAGDGDPDGMAAGTDRGGPPPGPRLAEQCGTELGAMAVEWIAQGGGAWPGCPRCGKPLAPPFFGGPLTWEYGQGFPKSMNVSKALDKAAGAERSVVGPRVRVDGKAPGKVGNSGERTMGRFADLPTEVTGPATPEAEQWDGWGTALKPAHEPIVVARKPLIGTVVKNVLTHGTGALNIDACRISTGDKLGGGAEKDVQSDKPEGWDRPWRNDAEAQAAHAERIRENVQKAEALGRWPANVVLSHSPDCEPIGATTVPGRTINRWDDGAKPFGGGAGHSFTSEQMEDDVVERWECVEGCPVKILDEQSGASKSAGGRIANISKTSEIYGGGKGLGQDISPEAVKGDPGYGDKGGASRFFYCAKAGKKERNAGLEDFVSAEGYRTTGAGLATVRRCVTHDRAIPSGSNSYECGCPLTYSGETEPRVMLNIHPTVKPISLMRWLIKLITPPGGLVLDPFMGSGTTGCAAVLEGFDFIGLEREAEYVAIATARLTHWANTQETE